MKQKLIFFDIDGTLIKGGTQKIPDSAIEAITKARENGHLCFINTGRTGSIVGEELTGQVEFDGLLLGCGTQIILHGKELFHRTIPVDLGQHVLECLYKYRVDAVLEGTFDSFAASKKNMFTDTFRGFLYPSGDRKVLSPLVEAPGNFDKFFCYAEYKEQMDGFQKELEDEFDFIDREHGFYEVVPRGCSKASGIYYLAEKLRIPMEDTVGVGDSTNDLNMFECVGTSIAMKESSKQILKIADYVTTDVQEDGIWNGLKWVGVL